LLHVDDNVSLSKGKVPIGKGGWDRKKERKTG
jgi:hypothetical protein